MHLTASSERLTRNCQTATLRGPTSRTDHPRIMQSCVDVSSLTLNSDIHGRKVITECSSEICRQLSYTWLPVVVWHSRYLFVNVLVIQSRFCCAHGFAGSRTLYNRSIIGGEKQKQLLSLIATMDNRSHHQCSICLENERRLVAL